MSRAPREVARGPGGRRLRRPGSPGRAVRRPDADAPADPRARRAGFWVLAPCLFYLFVDFVRPMDWVEALRAARPGLIAGVWSLATVLLARRGTVPRPLWYVFGLCAVMAVQVPLAVNNRWAFDGWLAFLIMVLGGVLPLATLPRGMRDVRVLIYAYVFLHLPLVHHVLTHSGVGPGGWLLDENDVALALNVAIGIAIYLVMDIRGIAMRLVLTLTIGAMLAGVVASHSRGGFVGLAVLGVYLLVVGPHRKGVAAVGALALTGLLLLAPTAYWQEVRSIRTAGELGDTGEKRLYFWGIAWRMFLDHPLIGVGTRNYGIRAPEYQDPTREGWAEHMWGRVAHSLYFTLLPEHGLAGVALFAAIVWWCFRTQRRLLRERRRSPDDPGARDAALLGSGVMAGVVGVLATGAFLSVLYYPVLWVLVGLLGSLSRIAERDRPPAAEAPAREARIRRRR